MRLHAKGQDIASIDEWFDVAPPKGKKDHWYPYRSAKEQASAWCPAAGGVAAPAEIVALLESHALTRGADVRAGVGTPEMQVKIDSYPGEPRNADLTFICPLPSLERGAPPRRLALSVEAKADETFGPRILGAIQAAERRRLAGKNSNGDRRARGLIAALLGPNAVSDARVLRLRYQLFTAAAGALAFALEQSADVAVLAVHEFRHAAGVHTRPSKLAANARELNTFVESLSGGRCTALMAWQLAGPFMVPGSRYISGTIPLLIGKAERTLP